MLRDGAAGHRHGRGGLVTADRVGLAHHVVIQAAVDGLLQRSNRGDLRFSGLLDGDHSTQLPGREEPSPSKANTTEISEWARCLPPHLLTWPAAVGSARRIEAKAPSPVTPS